jgi:hypothetical protein
MKYNKKFIIKNILKSTFTSLNIQFTLRRLSAARASAKPSRPQAGFVDFAPATFFCLREKCFAFFLIGRKKTSVTFHVKILLERFMA